MQVAELDYIAGSIAAQTAIAENDVGMLLGGLTQLMHLGRDSLFPDR